MTWYARTCMIALILSATLGAQDTTNLSSDATTVVNQLMPGANFITSFQEKMAQRSGDGVAVAIARTQPRAALRDPAKARRALGLIEMAFGNPNMIAAVENKNPGVSLLLLDAIIREAPDVTVQQAAKDLMLKLEGLAQAQK